MNKQSLDVLSAALVGDALGSHFNGLRHGHVRQLIGGAPDGFPQSGVFFPDKPERNHVPGFHTALGQRLIASLAIAGEDALGREPVARAGALLLELAGGSDGAVQTFGALRSPGKPLRHSLSAWKDSYPWAEMDYFTAEEPSEGMSTAVLGLVPLLAEQTGNGTDICVRLARLSHAHFMALIAPIAIHETTRLISQQEPGRKFDGVHVARELAATLKACEDKLIAENSRLWKELGWGHPPARLSTALSPLASLLTEENDELAQKTIVATAAESYPRNVVSHPQHGFVPAGLTWALYRALGPLPAVRAIEDVLERGGETSAITSIVAALMVLRHGPECLPDEWYARTRIVAKLDRFFPLTEDEKASAWIAFEQALSAEEHRLQQGLREELERQHRADIAKGKTTEPKSKPKPEKETGQELPFAPPPHIWLKPEEDAEDPRVKKKLRAARGRRKIEWKEERRQKAREEENGG